MAADYNAAVYDQQASLFQVKKGLTAEQYDRIIDKLEGESISAVASSGYDLSGSFLTVINDNLTQAYLDKNTELFNLEVGKRQSQSAAAESRRTGKAVKSAANVEAASTLLTQGNEWYQKYGGFGAKETEANTSKNKYKTETAPQSMKT